MRTTNSTQGRIIHTKQPSFAEATTTERVALGAVAGLWMVKLTSGENIEIAAHHYQQEDGEYSFILVLTLQPTSSLVVVRLPEELVASVTETF